MNGHLMMTTCTKKEGSVRYYNQTNTTHTTILLTLRQPHKIPRDIIPITTTHLLLFSKKRVIRNRPRSGVPNHAKWVRTKHIQPHHHHLRHTAIILPIPQPLPPLLLSPPPPHSINQPPQPPPNRPPRSKLSHQPHRLANHFLRILTSCRSSSRSDGGSKQHDAEGTDKEVDVDGAVAAEECGVGAVQGEDEGERGLG